MLRFLEIPLSSFEFGNLCKPSQTDSKHLPMEIVLSNNNLTNALPHVNSEWIINIDLKDYFDSISQKKVLDFFLQLGYEDSVSEFLSNVCTRFSHVTYQRALPQGAPTSPLLANFLTINLDKDLERLAEELDMRYTRYADDITFSGVQKTCPVTPRDIENIIYEHGFRPNKSKTRIRYKFLSARIFIQYRRCSPIRTYPRHKSMPTL